MVDVVALAIGWAGVLGLRTAEAGFSSTLGPHNVGWAALAIAVNVCLLAVQSLYLARVCAVRAVEVQGLGKSVVGTGIALVAAEQVLGQPVPLREVSVAALGAFATLIIGRGLFSGWLRRRRSIGDFIRRVVVVGSDADAVELGAVIREHPELGYRVCGFIGEPEFSDAIGAPHLGGVDDLDDALNRTSATGAVLIASALDADTLNELTRRLLARGAHVQLSSGLRGIAHRRFRATPLAYEPLFYVEPALLTAWQLRCKRTIDVVGAALGLIATAPVLAAAAVAIRLESPGPVLFRQQRVGRDGTCFTFFKLRTMVRNAEALRTDLRQRNRRTAGPLFKAPNDPRVTRVGRVLRATSIDELPQLWNVLRGDMSLVGPRPALPAEVEQFDERLRSRTDVAPGLTGLWQIEARDNPAFGPYRRLDLFYVENWSPLLDLEILVVTLVRVAGRALRIVGRPSRAGGPTELVLD